MNWAAIVAFAVALGLGVARAEDTHEVAPTDSGTSVSLTDYAKHIDDKAREYQAKYAGSVIDRIVLFDSVFPHDRNEFLALDGYTVMLVSAVTHDQSELPLARLYLTMDGKELEMPVIARTRRAVSKGSATYQTFGPFREDVFVIVPSVLLFYETCFSADFAAHRQGFEFGRGPMNAPDYLIAERSLVTSTVKASPAPAAFLPLIRREYPGFLAK